MSVLSEFISACHDNIFDNSKGSKNALEYLLSRNITEESIRYHRIGYRYNNTDLPYGIRKYGKNEESTCDYSFFINGKVIVPVYTEFGSPVGLASRTPSHDKGNKWWNLPKPFHKGNHLYLLDKSRKHIFDNDKVYIVEGYIDAILLYQNGLKNVCALMGTALTNRKIGLIARYTNNICLCLDEDENESGQKARDTSVISLNRFAFCNDISVIDGLSKGEDPADYISKYSLEDFLATERTLKHSEILKVVQNAKYREKKRANK